MGKVRPTFGHNPMAKLTHTQCRAKVCIKCFEAKKSLRDVSGNADWIQKFKENIGPNFDISNPRLPTGLCDSCRKMYFTKTKEGQPVEEIKFRIPDYLQFVVAPENVDESFDCAICLKIRPNGKKSGLLNHRKSPHAGGRPPKTPEIKKTSLKAPDSPGLCKRCLRLKDNDHDKKKCNTTTLTRTIISLTHDENGKPNEIGEKIAARVIKGMEASEDGKTILLAQLATGKKLPITLGHANAKPRMRIKAKDLLKFQIVNNLTDTTTKKLATFINQLVDHGTIESGFQQKLRDA